MSRAREMAREGEQHLIQGPADVIARLAEHKKQEKHDGAFAVPDPSPALLRRLNEAREATE